MDLAAEIRSETGRAFEPKGRVFWAADGSQIAVLNAADGQLYAIDLATKALRRIDSRFVAYSPPIPSAVHAVTWGAVKALAR